MVRTAPKRISTPDQNCRSTHVDPRRSLLRLICRAALALSLLACAGGTAGTSQGVTPDNFLGYQPIPPQPAPTYEEYDPSTKATTEKRWSSLEKKQILALLPLQYSESSVRKIESSGDIKYLTASVSGDAGSYEVIMDYMKCRVEDVLNDGKSLGVGRIGVGFRITAAIVTHTASINLGSLLAIGAEAKNGTLAGSLRVEVIGIDSPDVTTLIPLNAELDQTSLQSALQALATVKAKIWDDNTSLTPHILAIRQQERGHRDEITHRAGRHTATQQSPQSSAGISDSQRK
jgi:hypothetical protein